MKRIVTALAAAASIAALGACSSPTDEAATSTPAAALAATTATDVACKDAPDKTVKLIEAALTTSGQTLANAQAVEAGDVIYIGANIMEGEKREHSAEVWASKGAAVYALSSNARKSTSLPDGRKILGANAGDQYGAAVQQCVVKALRKENGAD